MPNVSYTQPLPATVNNDRSTMKIIKRILLILLVLTTVGFLFRGWFYRQLVTYKSVGHRTNYSATDKKLVDYINANTDEQTDPNIEQIIKLGLSITSGQLNFTDNKNDLGFGEIPIKGLPRYLAIIQGFIGWFM